MDVIKYLEEDHQNVLSLLEKLQKTSNLAVKNRKKLFDSIKQELYLHEQAEEKVLYPALEKKSKSDVLEAYQEHHVANLIIADIESISFDDDTFKPKVTVLLENIKHHIKEERAQLFPLTRKHYNKIAREQMTVEMEKVKEGLK